MFSDLDNVTSWRLMLGSEIVSHLEGKDDLSGCYESKVISLRTRQLDTEEAAWAFRDTATADSAVDSTATRDTEDMARYIHNTKT